MNESVMKEFISTLKPMDTAIKNYKAYYGMYPEFVIVSTRYFKEVMHVMDKYQGIPCKTTKKRNWIKFRGIRMYPSDSVSKYDVVIINPKGEL